MARTQQPVPTRRLILHGELLQVLGDTLLRENGSDGSPKRRRSVDRERRRQGRVPGGAVARAAHAAHPILGWTSILRLQSDPKVVHAAEVIERNALLQIRLVEDLLELTRATRGKLALHLKAVCLNDLLRTALDAVAEGAHAKDITLQFIDAPEPLCIERGRRSPAAGLQERAAQRPEVHAGRRSDHDHARGRRRSGRRARARHGRRDRTEFLPFAFGMFQQQEQGTRRTYPGLGIGLALVKQLTEAHGGTVSVASDGVRPRHAGDMRLPLAPGSVQGEPLRSHEGDLRASTVSASSSSRTPRTRSKPCA